MNKELIEALNLLEKEKNIHWCIYWPQEGTNTAVTRFINTVCP